MTDPYRGRTALITGASSGIGAAFATELAGRGSDLVLVARSGDKLREMASALATRYGVRAHVIPADLAAPNAARTVADEVAVAGLSVELLVNNAGFGTHGPFEELDPDRELEMVAVNVGAVVAMTREFVPAMVHRGGGGILNVASAAAFQPTPGMATYGATKAFVLSFSEALATEYRGRGIHVLAFCPGAVATGFASATGNDEFATSSFFAGAPTADEIVPVALDALARGRSVVVPGVRNKALAQAPRLAPRSLTARIAQRYLRP